MIPIAELSLGCSAVEYSKSKCLDGWPGQLGTYRGIKLGVAEKNRLCEGGHCFSAPKEESCENVSVKKKNFFFLLILLV